MSERSIESILDRFRKKDRKPEKADADAKKSGSERKDPVLYETESEKLKGYLLQAKEKEHAGDQKGAYELYAKYKKEFVAIKARTSEAGREVVPPEYLEALSEIFKSEELDRVDMPKSEELTDEYFDKMYPEEQREEDTARALVSYRPSWWNDTADSDVVGPEHETWGEAYRRSIVVDAKMYENAVFFTESIQKPNYKDGSQQYGSMEGDDADWDPLLPIIKKVFGDEANRFDLAWNQINNNLLPQIKSKIEEIFKKKRLSIPKFDVVLTPALVSNLQMTNFRPENSQTDTYEWTSTHLLKQDGTDSGRRLGVGRSEDGGAGCVRDFPREGRWSNRGFRLSVVFEK